jgi:hypothetical protein
VKRPHQPQVGQNIGEVAPGSLDGLNLNRGLIDHAVVPFGYGSAGIETALCAERVGREAIGLEFVGVEETA